MNEGVQASRIPHVAALDGARGLAVAGVLFFHGGHLKGGYLGVDFFFTLSGFLITSLLLAESDRTGAIGLGGFWARRARRLLPALVVLMAGIALYSFAFAKPEQLGQIRGDALATLAYAANWHEIFSHQNYFALFTTPSPLNHTWSLAIEEQFYVIWPLVFVALLARWKRDTPKAVLVTTLTLAAISTALMIALYKPSNANRVYFGTDTRAAAILFGAALAAWLAINGPTKTRHGHAIVEGLGIAGAIALAVCWVRLDGQSATLYRGGFLLCGLAATAIIAAAVHPEPGPIARVLSLRWLCALGLISYGVYLYHWPIDVFLDRQRAGISGWPLFVLQTAMALGVAIASYRIIEQPIRHGTLNAGQLRKLTPAVAVALVVAIVASTTGAQTIEFASAALSKHPLVEANRAFKAAPPGSRRIMVVGDSVALRLAEALQHINTTPPLAVFNTGIPGCNFPPQLKGPPIVMPDGGRLTQTPCEPVWQGAAVERFRPDVVFWIVTGGRGGAYNGHSYTPCTTPYNTLYRASLEKEVAILGAQGAKVVITTAAYERAFEHENTDIPTACDNQLRRQVAAKTGAQLVDLFSYICPNGKCRAKQDGVILRDDGLHYEGAGGEIVARWLLSQVR